MDPELLPVKVPQSQHAIIAMPCRERPKTSNRFHDKQEADSLVFSFSRSAQVRTQKSLLGDLGHQIRFCGRVRKCGAADKILRCLDHPR